MRIENVWVCVEGEGETILLLHGWGASHELMKPIFEHYKTTHKVVMLDLAGFGKSIPLERKYTIQDYVLDIEEIVKVYKLENISIIAHSFGARIAFAFAKNNPVKRMILTGAAGIPSKKNISYYFKIAVYKILKNLNIKNNMGSEDYRNASSFLKETLVGVLHYDSRKDIQMITCPILLVWGEKDTQTPLWMADQIKRLNANVSIVVFEKEDHFAYFHEMQRFLKVCDILLKGEN